MVGTGLDYFAVDEPSDDLSLGQKLARASLPTAVGALAAYALRRSHPVLAFIGASALVGNAQAVAQGERTPKEAFQRLGRHVMATAGALAMPGDSNIAAGLGYGAGAVAADLVFDGHNHDGVLDEWARYVGVDVNKKTDEKETTAITVKEKRS